MNNFEYRKEIDHTQMVDEIARMVQRRVDQAALDKSAGVLARYGYVKVVRCRDCANYEPTNQDGCKRINLKWADSKPDGYCAWAERKVGE